MKKTFLLIIFGLLSSPIFTQSTINFQNLNCKKGIYLSFEEIIKNTPSFTDSFTVKERTNGNIVMWGGGNYTFELTSNKKSEYKKLKKDLVGISDGINFYISDKYTTKGWQGMTLCILSGPYIIANIQGNAGQYTGGGLIPSMIKVGNGYLINIEDGNSVPLTNKILKKLLKPYPEIAKKYSETEELTRV